MLHPRYRKLQHYLFKRFYTCRGCMVFSPRRRNLQHIVDPPGSSLPSLYPWSIGNLNSRRSMLGNPTAKTPGSPHPMQGGVARGPSGPLHSRVGGILLAGLLSSAFLFPLAVRRGYLAPSSRPKHTASLAPSASILHPSPRARYTLDLVPSVAFLVPSPGHYSRWAAPKTTG